MSDFNNEIKCYKCNLKVTGKWIYNPDFITGKNPPYYHMSCWFNVQRERKETKDGKQPLQPKG